MSQSYDPGSGRPRDDVIADQRYQGTAQPGAPPSGQEGIAPLISDLLKDLQDLVRGEFKLAKVELKESASSAARGAGMIAGGAVVGIVGFIILMLGVAYLLDIWMPMWVAAGIVGIVLLVIGAILALSGKSALSAQNLTPDQTIDSLKEDQTWAKQEINSVKS
ncbi:MAG TPA: phage holin family protein [Thermomicrobiales bacterium]|nr:phage holin family protein [Thermomicrobiales bacterium]